jgi:hypothetical protein
MNNLYLFHCQEKTFYRNLFFVQNVVHLTVDDECTYNKYNRGSKLKYHQGTPQDRAFAAPAQLSFQYINGLESREVYGRI